MLPFALQDLYEKGRLEARGGLPPLTNNGRCFPEHQVLSFELVFSPSLTETFGERPDGGARSDNRPPRADPAASRIGAGRRR